VTASTRRWTALGALCLAALAVAPARADVSGPEIVGFLNAQRAAHGIPAGIAEDPVLSDGCAKHNRYGAVNGILEHGEDPSLPAYTPEGDQAGRTSVLYAGGGPWGAERNPFETAPIHLHQLLAPRIDRMGAAENEGYGCATTLASRNRPAPAADVTYTYPGDGARGWPADQTARELPYTPGELLGIPEGTRTGPYLYAMFDGPDLTVSDTARAAAATLTGPDGPVELAVADNHTPGLEGFLPPGLELIPRSPLRANATYTATLRADVTTEGGSGPQRAFEHRWTFITGQFENAVRITGYVLWPGNITVRAQSRAPGAVVTLTGPGTSASAPLSADGTATIGVDRGGTWNACVRSGGAGSDHRAAEACQTVTIPAPIASNPAVVAGDSPFTVDVPRRVRAGRRIRLTVSARERFELAFRLLAPNGRTLTRYPRTALAGGRAWTFTLRVPARHARRGRSVRLRMTIVTGGTRHAVRRTIRFR